MYCTCLENLHINAVDLFLTNDLDSPISVNVVPLSGRGDRLSEGAFAYNLRPGERTTLFVQWGYDGGQTEAISVIISYPQGTYSCFIAVKLGYMELLASQVVNGQC